MKANDFTAQGDDLQALVWADVSAAELQSRLIDLGYYDGRVDGTPGPLTLAALARFQHDHGLPVTGRPDPQTVQTLRESYCF
jgi:peptidoglycan hydrolase-like protein with peptidoglycan-binding domain